MHLSAIWFSFYAMVLFKFMYINKILMKTKLKFFILRVTVWLWFFILRITMWTTLCPTQPVGLDFTSLYGFCHGSGFCQWVWIWRPHWQDSLLYHVIYTQQWHNALIPALTASLALRTASAFMVLREVCGFESPVMGACFIKHMNCRIGRCRPCGGVSCTQDDSQVSMSLTNFHFPLPHLLQLTHISSH